MIHNRPHLATATCLHHVEKSKLLLHFLKSLLTSGLAGIVFDEKYFHVDAQPNWSNSLYLSDQAVDKVDHRIRFNPMNKDPQKVMVLLHSGPTGRNAPPSIDAAKKIDGPGLIRYPQDGSRTLVSSTLNHGVDESH